MRLPRRGEKGFSSVIGEAIDAAGITQPQSFERFRRRIFEGAKLVSRLGLELCQTNSYSYSLAT